MFVGIFIVPTAVPDSTAAVAVAVAALVDVTMVAIADCLICAAITYWC